MGQDSFSKYCNNRRHGVRHPRALVAGATLLTAAVMPSASYADEGGVSFWVPGFFGSLASTPQQPGFSFTSVYYHTSVSASGDVAAARQVSAGNFTANLNTNLNLRLNADANLAFLFPNYVFATPVFGGQASLGLLVPLGQTSASVDGTLTAALGPLGFAISGGRSDTATGNGDLAPFYTLRWNQGVNSYMTYITGDIPVGVYSSTSLANLGLGHSAIDAGAGYTYFDEAKGHEFSITGGFTYNFLNPTTQYQSGVDLHIDWGASQFLTKQLQIGAVGYIYDQLSCDSGSGDRVGCFESRVIGVGPQIGYVIPINHDYQGYLNLKGYREFDADHRADGWNVWLTLVLSPAAPTPTSKMSMSMYHK
jgi:hypothetical protein